MAAPTRPTISYFGAMDDGVEELVYLSVGEQIVLARAGDAVESGYKVVTIDERQVVVEHVADGHRQTLSRAGADPSHAN